jgi:MSHA biogenesis protein MshN
VDQAIATLDFSLMRAGQSAEYHAFYAALLQRKNRHAEAVEHYQIALKAAPKTAAWLMGYGISLQALARVDEAKEAYQRALDTKNLSPELQAFVQQKIHNL